MRQQNTAVQDLAAHTTLRGRHPGERPDYPRAVVEGGDTQAEPARLSRGERRGALVAAAERLFSRRPYDDIFISDIAEEAGVAKGLLYHHFKDKRGLYLEVLRQSVREIIDLHEDAEGEDTPERRLRGVVRRQIEYRRDHAHTTLALMRAGGQDPEVDELFEQGRRAGADFVLNLLRVEGPPPPRLRAAVRGCMGFVDEMTVDWLTHGTDMDINEVVQLAYTAVVAVLSMICDDQQVSRDVVERLRPTV
jgi:AcrR family transcriptional regulator